MDSGTVVMMVLLLFTFPHWNDAPMRHFAHHVLKLDRRMNNAEIMRQAFLHVSQDALTDRRRNVCDRNMTRKRVTLRADAPDVKIVDFIYSFDRPDGRLDLFQLHTPWRAFEQNVERLAHDAEAGPQNQHADPEGESGINPVISRH